MADESITHEYFVDEAGDLALFGRRKKILVGTPGCSKFFMVGVAHLQNYRVAEEALGHLREELLADPYFKDVPSMQTKSQKTALFFHAKNDLPEVRREVFKLLKTLQTKVQVAIRRKTELIHFTKLLHSSGERLTESYVYDDLVKRLFRNLLHKADRNTIVFARRGKRTRRFAMEEAIVKARRNFEAKCGRPSDKPVKIICKSPVNCPRPANHRLLSLGFAAALRTRRRSLFRIIETQFSPCHGLG